MRLTSITLRNYRGIDEHTIEFADGITVVEGPNEVGKSSIPEALRLLRTEYDTAKKQIIKDIRPVHRDASPEVEARLTTGPYDVTYRKRWGKGGLTELHVHTPRREMLTGRDAHDRFEQILSDTLDIDLLDALEVQQGKSLLQPELAKLGALHRALDDGDGVGGTEDDTLAAAIETEVARYFTSTGKPTGEYRAAKEAVVARASELEELRARSREIDGWVDAHARSCHKVEDLAAQLEEARTAHAELSGKHQVLAGLRTAVATAEQQLAAAQTAQRHAASSHDDRAALVEEHRGRTEDLAAATEALPDPSTKSDLAAQLEQAEAAHRHAVTARDAARTALHELSRARDEAARRARHAVLTERVTRAEEADDRRRDALAALKQQRVTATDVRRLEQAVLAVQAAEQARRAAAAVVEVTPLGHLPITVAGTPVDGATSRSVLEPTTVRVEGVVELTLRPGQPPETLEATQEAARAKRDAICEELQVSGLEEAEACAEQHDQAQEALRAAERALELVLLHDTLDALRDQLAEVEHGLEDAEPEATGEAQEPDWDALLEQAAAAESDAFDAVGEAEAAVARLRRAAEAEATAGAIAEQRVGTARAELERITARLAAARETQSDDALARAVEASSLAADAAALALTEQQRALAEADADRLDLEFDNVTQLVERLGKELQGAKDEVLAHRTRLDDAERQGVFDALAQAEAAHAAALERASRLDRAASAAWLLASTFDAHRATAQAAYVAPFKAAIERLGKLLHGHDFEVEVTPELQLATRTAGGRTVAFHQLSGGAQEQLALLGRLAAAQLVAEQGAPVILDDALGFADPERLRALALVLHEVGRSAQIILLTCQPARYASLGSATVVALTDD